MRKRTSKYNLADVAVSTRRINYFFFSKIEKIINWKEIEELINNNYSRGTRVDGRPAYPGLLLFKICCIEKWFGFHHKQTVDRINDSISFTRFIGLSLNEEVPSSTTLMRFRNEMNSKNLYGNLFRLIDEQLENRQIKLIPGSCRTPRIIRKSAN